MERVTFLVEETGERLDCLLNPESIDISRRSGVRARRSFGGALTGRGSSDDPLLYTGGGPRTLSLLWQIYSRCGPAPIHLRQCGHR